LKIYAIEGEKLQIILADGVTKKAAGLGSEYKPMKSERPSSECVASSGGVWVLLKQEETIEETV
jgi:hypothetical protein